mmetsp:Transcript_18299/g.36866  ORF Transcript_18299/g.36866 Transcript_18299/m.36866 type:complete len:299 (-) Transcript_18299:81-977(-)
MDYMDEVTKRLILAELEEEVPTSKEKQRRMLLANLEVIKSSDESTVDEIDAALSSTARILGKARCVQEHRGEHKVCVSCSIGEDTIKALFADGIIDAVLLILQQRYPRPNVYHMACGALTLLCSTHEAKNVAKEIVAKGGFARVLELMEELISDEFMQLTFTRFISVVSQLVDTKTETSRCLEILPVVMSHHKNCQVVYFSACTAMGYQFGPDCVWSQETGKALCESLLDGIVRHAANKEVHALGRSLLFSIVGEERAVEMIDRKLVEQTLFERKKAHQKKRTGKKKSKNKGRRSGRK